MHFRFLGAIRIKNSKKKASILKTRTLHCVSIEAGSFESFCDNYEVLDSRKQKVIKNRHRLYQLYKHRHDPERPVYIFNKN
jgi:hypothetical protein